MGIRFQCPQGHLINVKDFLAGKKGVCPDCGAKVRIPKASTHHKDGSLIANAAAQPVAALAAAPAETVDMNPAAFAPANPAAVVPVTPAPITGAIPAGVPVGIAPAASAVPVRAIPVTAIPVGGAPAAYAAPVAMPAGMHAVAAYPVPGGMPAPALGGMRPPINPGGPMPPGLMDPISEAPHATWYIRPAAGGQFGPARGDVMRQWLQEGRLSADSLVWRDGWTEWKNAALVFPQLAETPAEAPQEFVKTEKTIATAAQYSAKRPSGNATGIVMIVLLGLICVGLLIALVVLLPKMK